MKTVVIIAVVIIGLLAVLVIVGLASLSLTSFQQSSSNRPNATTPSQTTSTPSPIATTTVQPSENPSSTITPQPAPSNSYYVEVDYKTIGWFYGAINEYEGYNYTYLVLNVTIINRGYSQVNPDSSNGFDVVINNNKYQSQSSMLYFETIYGSSGTAGYADSYDFGGSALPYSATLLNTGNITGIVIFQFGDPSVYPAQPQILNAPFVLQYSITYGNSDALFPTNAKVIINQVG